MDVEGHPTWRRLHKGWSDFVSHPLVCTIQRQWRHEYGLLIVTIGAAVIAARLIEIPGKAPDFTVFWAAATNAFGPVYDSEFITPLQNGPPGPRPFANPPTFLLMLLLFGLLQYKAAYVAWVSLSVAAFFATGLRLTQFIWLALFSSTLISVALIGQTTLLAGSLAVLGLMLARRQSVLAGLSLGVAVCIKPQLVILTPVALLLLQDVRAIISAGLTVMALSLAATITFGFAIWSEWILSLAEFRATTQQLAIGQLSLPATLPAQGLGALVFLVLMALAAHLSDRPRLIISTLGGSLLLSPYAAHYESVVMLIPALALLRPDWRILPIAFLLWGGAITTIPFGLVVGLLALPAKSTEFSRSVLSWIIAKNRSVERN